MPHIFHQRMRLTVAASAKRVECTANRQQETLWHEPNGLPAPSATRWRDCEKTVKLGRLCILTLARRSDWNANLLGITLAGAIGWGMGGFFSG
jgi:hypothetical protein